MGEAGEVTNAQGTFSVSPCSQGHRLNSSLLHLHVLAPFRENELCPTHPLERILALHGQTPQLTVVVSFPRPFPAQAIPTSAISTSSACCPAQSSRAAQSGLAP